MCSIDGAKGMPEADLGQGFPLPFPECAPWHSVHLTRMKTGKLPASFYSVYSANAKRAMRKVD